MVLRFLIVGSHKKEYFLSKSIGYFLEDALLIRWDGIERKRLYRKKYENGFKKKNNNL